MDEAELAQEFLNYLNEHGLYHSFIAWEEERGYNPEQMESDIMEFENTHGE